MTTITYNHTDDDVFELTVCGHSGYNPGGPDIVCSACSVLSYALLQSLLSGEDRGMTDQFATDIDDDAGYFHVMTVPHAWASREIAAAFDVIVGGFALLAANYPDFVKFEVKNGENCAAVPIYHFCRREGKTSDRRGGKTSEAAGKDR